MNIQPGGQIADFGSGSGYFTLIMARLAGEDGLVTAVDVLQNKLDTVKAAARAQGLLNINYIRADLEVEGGSQLAEASQDMVVLANILFQSQKKAAMVKEAGRVLKPGGELVVIDWEPASSFGPKDGGWKLSKEEARNLASGSFNLVKEIEVSSHHWGLLFKKK
ncbi:MAG: methyltransferase domain-containing protein [Parcubacteria group bacterium]|nr:methyltransferase domain-containing protein [Parcubacteria group bacterium]